MKVSLCIPMYNESSIINDTLKTVSEYMKNTFEDYEVIFCDDGSRDNCRAAVENFSDPNILAVGYENNRGKGCAIRHGVMSASGDVIIFTDCDLAYGLEVVKTAADIFASDDSIDMVIGSRNLSGDGYEGYTPIRKIASKIYIRCLSLIGGFNLSDSQCGFKGFRRDMAKKIFSECEVDGFAFDFEVIIKGVNFGAKIKEMPVKIINHRESKIHVFSDSIKMLRDAYQIKKRNKHKNK